MESLSILSRQYAENVYLLSNFCQKKDVTCGLYMLHVCIHVHTTSLYKVCSHGKYPAFIMYHRSMQ